MGYQKTIEKPNGVHRNNGNESQPVELGKNVADFTHDVASLAEMQAELFTIDLKEATSISVLPLCIGVAGVLLLIGAFPVLLIGLAYLMVASWNVTPATAFFATGAAAVLISAGIVWIVWLRLRAGALTFQRSINALQANFQWLKRRLRSSGTNRTKTAT